MNERIDYSKLVGHRQWQKKLLEEINKKRKEKGLYLFERMIYDPWEDKWYLLIGNPEKEEEEKDESS